VNRSLLLPLAAALVLAGCASVPPQGNPTGGGAPSASDTRASASTPPATASRRATETRDRSQAADDSAAPDNLWERIRRGYAIPGHDNPRVERQFNDYVSYGDYWLRVSRRAQPYLYPIVETLEARDIPLELALLPIVESAFRPFAYSHGRAAGIWQFVPATGRHYGLEQNWWYDGRRDVLAATDAAVNYLSYLGEMFDGDWLLAIAAYNAGEGTVQRAIRRNRQAGRPTDYWSLDLPQETMNYVPRLLAISELVANPEDTASSSSPLPTDRR